MGSNRPGSYGRVSRVASILMALSLAACAGRPPVLVPPPSGVDAVEGFAAASVAGAEASIKGKFAFLFRRPGQGRIEAVDPIGRTAFLIYFGEGRAWFVLPSKKAYAEDNAETMMRRFLGISLRPDDTLALLSGIWPEDGEEGGWSIARDGQGRAAGGERGEFAFTVREFFRGGAVPREIAVSGAGTTGRVKVLKAAFNPAPREAAFDMGFLSRFAAKTWDEIMELIER